MKDKFLNEIKAFVAKEWSEPKDGLSAQTSLNDDLGMDGDDGVEFMLAFSKHFAVDLSSFPHNKYFGPEAAANPISLIICAVRRVTTGRWNNLSPLTLQDLAEAAERGRWVEGKEQHG
jgi:acyl carrier protein